MKENKTRCGTRSWRRSVNDPYGHEVSNATYTYRDNTIVSCTVRENSFFRELTFGKFQIILHALRAESEPRLKPNFSAHEI